MPRRLSLLLLGLTGAVAAAQPVPTVPAVSGRATAPTEQGGANRAIVVAGPDGSFVVGTAELAGLEIYDLSGTRIGRVPAGEAVGIDIRYDALALNGQPASVVVAADAESGALRFFAPGRISLAENGAAPVPLGFAVEGVCLYHSAQDGSLYAFAVGDGGEVDQYLLFEQEPGRVGARKVRQLNVPSPAEHCVADDRTGQLYVSEEAVGVWRFTAEPETDVGLPPK